MPCGRACAGSPPMTKRQPSHRRAARGAAADAVGPSRGLDAAGMMRSATVCHAMLSRRMFATALGASVVARSAGAEGSAMTHVVLIGDSVFDKGAYVAGGPDVVRQLRGVLPGGWRATLTAVDG